MKLFVRILLIFALASSLFAQQEKGTAEQPPKKDFFKLNFSMYELDNGKRTNQRDYMLIANPNNQTSSVSIGTRVPVFMEASKMTYVNAGLSIRCTTKEVDQKLQAECE